MALHYYFGYFFNGGVKCVELPEPTSNTLSYYLKGCVLYLGPSGVDALQQSIIALALGSSVMATLSEQDFNQLIELGIDPAHSLTWTRCPIKSCYQAIVTALFCIVATPRPLNLQFKIEVLVSRL